MPRITHTTGERWYSGRFGGVAFHRIETKDVSEEVADWLVTLDNFERADDSGTGTGTGTGTETSSENSPTLKAALDGTIDGLEGDLSSGAYDDRLDDLAALERENQNRNTALEAIDARRDELPDETVKG